MNGYTKTYVLEFRISELKSVLNQISLPATGRKAELQARIFHYFGEPFNNSPPDLRPAREEWRLQSASGSSHSVCSHHSTLESVRQVIRNTGHTFLIPHSTHPASACAALECCMQPQQSWEGFRGLKPRCGAWCQARISRSPSF